MEYDPSSAARSMRTSIDASESVDPSIDDREAPAVNEIRFLSRRNSLRASSDGGLPATSSSHPGSVCNSCDGGLPPLRSWRGSLQNSCDGGLPTFASRRESFRNSVDAAVQPSTAADAGTLMHRLSNISSAAKSEVFDMEGMDDVDDLTDSAGSSESEGFQEVRAGDLARDDPDADPSALSPTNQFSDFSFKNYGLLAEHNMEALRAEFAEAHAEKARAPPSTE